MSGALCSALKVCSAIEAATDLGSSLRQSVELVVFYTALNVLALFCLHQFFDKAGGVNVPRSRFLPVKGCSDLLLVQVRRRTSVCIAEAFLQSIDRSAASGQSLFWMTRFGKLLINREKAMPALLLENRAGYSFFSVDTKGHFTFLIITLLVQGSRLHLLLKHVRPQSRAV